MQGFHPGRKLVFVLSGKYLFVCKLAVLDWQEGAVYVRIGFIQVYDESDNVFLAVFVRNEVINILCPFLNVLASGKMRIVRSVSQIHLLGTECQFRHTVT